MTDNEVIFCFTNGCDLLKNDDVDMADMNKIRKSLENCAKEMLPLVHRYVTKRDCYTCKHNKANSYVECKYRNKGKCEMTIDRPNYEKELRI